MERGRDEDAPPPRPSAPLYSPLTLEPPLLTLLLLAGPARAATLTVKADGSGDYSTISAAILAASSGDRIEVASGTWREVVDFGGKAVRVVGTAGAGATILDGGGAAYAVRATHAETSGARLEGFTIHNSGGRGILVQAASPTFTDLVLEDLDASSDVGGALVIDGGEPALNTTTFEGDTAGYGGAIYVGSGSPHLYSCTLSGNEASAQGGAIYVAAGTLLLTSTSLDDNLSAAEGGAIYLASGAALEMTDATLSDNHSEDGHGAGVYGAGDNDVVLADSELSANYPNDYADGYGGGALYMSGGTLSVSGSSFEANYGYYGAAIWLYGTAASFEDASFSLNYGYYGGAVYMTDGASLVDVNGLYDTNTSYYYGAGVYAYYYTDLSFQGSTFNENAAYYGYGAAVFAQVYGSLALTDVTLSTNTSYYSGGAIYAYLLDGGVSLDGCTFSENTATYGQGGAIYAYYLTPLTVEDSTFTYNEAYGSGGAIYSYYYTGLSVAGSTFQYNLARYTSGGAIYYAPSVTGYDLSFSDNVVSDNAARYEGGGLCVFGGSTIGVSDSLFQENVLEDDSFGGGLSISDYQAVAMQRNTIRGNSSVIGGGLFLGEPYDAAATTRLFNNIFADNSATRVAGGLGAIDSASLTLTNNTLIGNTAPEGGGAVYLYETASRIRNNVLTGTIDGAALVIDGAEAVASSTLQYNDLYANAAGDLGGDLDASALDDTSLALDPLLAGYRDDGDPSDDHYALALTSPCIDAGDPSILDVDGSRSDIGAYGGPSADIADADADGYDSNYDCDDEDAAVYPGADEVWYDDIDEDCSSGSDYDQDGDGHDTPYNYGDDCDDTDPEVIDCPEPDSGDTGPDSAPPDSAPPDSGPEPQDSAPPADTAQPKPDGCACTTGGARSGWPGLLLAAGLLRRRYRRAAPSGPT